MRQLVLEAGRLIEVRPAVASVRWRSDLAEPPGYYASSGRM